MIDVEIQDSPWYTIGMGRPPRLGEKKSEKIAAKITPTVKEAINALVQKFDRTESYVVSALIEYALSATSGGESIFRPSEPEKPETIQVERRVLSRAGREAVKKRAGNG
jgi:actin-like ATPase involved in cell morphogenesis